MQGALGGSGRQLGADWALRWAVSADRKPDGGW